MGVKWSVAVKMDSAYGIRPPEPDDSSIAP